MTSPYVDSQTEQLKAAVAREAVDRVIGKEDKVIGIGSGSTIVYAVQRLKERMMEENLQFICIPTSYQSKALIISHGLPLGDLESTPLIDVAIDGADEIHLESGSMIKGGGGALLREKIIANAARRFTVIADNSKISPRLGTKWKQGIPLEVLPFAHSWVSLRLKQLFPESRTVLRQAVRKAGPVVTDNGNFLIDFDLGIPIDPENVAEIERKICTIPGILENGFFHDIASDIFISHLSGLIEHKTLKTSK